MESASRFNKGKLRWDLMDYEFIEQLLEILEQGAEEYGPFNWQKGLNREETLESAQRHLAELFKKNETDSKSKKSHAAHVAVNMMFYLYYLRNNKFVLQRNNPFNSKQIEL